MERKTYTVIERARETARETEESQGVDSPPAPSDRMCHTQAGRLKIFIREFLSITQGIYKRNQLPFLRQTK